jgi:type I restriction enzyme S subunit
MEAWPTRRMDELCEITSSKRIFAADYVSEGVPFYRGKEITEKYKGNLDVSTELFISEEKFIEIERKFGAPKLGDLLLTSVGTLGSLYVVKPGDRFYFKDGNLTWFRNFKGLDSQFLYCWLAAPQGKAELQKCTIGSSQSAFTIVLLKGMEIELPPLPVQRRIAGILSAYDELIENSQRRIRLLEDMARALYREWFVHFRFPGHESVPRLPSALGDIPQGWEVKLVKDILARRSAGSVYREVDVKQEGAIPVLDQSTNELLGFHDNEADHVASPESPLAIFGDHTCKMQLLIEPFSVGPNVVPFASDAGLPTAYVFFAVSSLVQTQEYKRHWIPLNAKEVVVADITIAQRFASLIQPMLIEQATLSKVIHNLRRTRDLLLPRLLSGQVALADVSN